MPNGENRIDDDHPSDGHDDDHPSDGHDDDHPSDGHNDDCEGMEDETL